MTVDMYVRLGLPSDQKTRDQIFLTVTPQQSPSNPNISVITLNDIYSRFVEMDVRNRVRDIITGYDNFQAVLNNYSTVNKQITAAAIAAFKDSGVPLVLEDAQLSQVLPDPQVWDSEVKKKSADAFQSQIDIIGAAIARNPGYLEYLKWQALQAIAATAAQNGNNLIIVTDGTAAPNFVVNPPTTSGHTANSTTNVTGIITGR